VSLRLAGLGLREVAQQAAAASGDSPTELCGCLMLCGHDMASFERVLKMYFKFGGGTARVTHEPGELGGGVARKPFGNVGGDRRGRGPSLMEQFEISFERLAFSYCDGHSPKLYAKLPNRELLDALCTHTLHRRGHYVAL
jgi:hypothetical protein